MRISRALALAGIDSRRKCEAYVLNGAVRVNGEIVRDLGRQVDLESDDITFRGRGLQKQKFVYFILNKPMGYSTTAWDPYATKTVFDLLPGELAPRTVKNHRTRVFPVGRLDRNSTGLLLFTNDGEMANRLTHPRYGVGKWYEVKLDRALEPFDTRRLVEGVRLEEGWVNAEKITKLSRRRLQVLIREGKKREVRRIFEKLEYEVLELCRVAFGPILLGDMPLGNGRFLTPAEISTLKGAVYETTPTKKRPKRA